MDDKKNSCNICDTELSETWWKCCPQHTTEKGSDVICERCKNRLHPTLDVEKKKVYNVIFGGDHSRLVARIEIASDDLHKAMQAGHNFDMCTAINSVTGDIEWVSLHAQPAEPLSVVDL